MQFGATSFYLEEPEGVSGNRISLPSELDFREARQLPQGWRNNDYGGWDGLARINFPTRGVGLELRADPVYRHLMIYADPTKPYFCVEPQTNASGAFSRPGGFADPREGVIVLVPGESAEGAVRFGAFRL
jgi:aldose 1-epimerase